MGRAEGRGGEDSKTCNAEVQVKSEAGDLHSGEIAGYLSMATRLNPGAVHPDKAGMTFPGRGSPATRNCY